MSTHYFPTPARIHSITTRSMLRPFLVFPNINSQLGIDSSQARSRSKCPPVGPPPEIEVLTVNLWAFNVELDPRLCTSLNCLQPIPRMIVYTGMNECFRRHMMTSLHHELYFTQRTLHKRISMLERTIWQWLLNKSNMPIF